METKRKECEILKNSGGKGVSESKLIPVLAIVLAVVILVGVIVDRFNNDSVAERGEAEDVELVISELCAKNDTIIADPNGKHSDWIEIYNSGDDCNLKGFTVSDGKKVSEPFDNMPLGHGEYKLLFLGRTNVGFSLSGKGGETVTLRNRDDSIVTQVKTVEMTGDQVMAWNGVGYELTFDATPGFPNTVEGRNAFVNGIPDRDPDIVINEILASNKSILPDEKGVFSDLVELYNISGKDISLSGYWLSDRQEERFRYALPGVTLPAGGYLVVFLDGGNYYADSGEVHAAFGLSEGESVVLTSPKGKYTTAEALQTADNEAILRTEEGEYEKGTPSPGFANTGDGVAAFLQSRVDEDAALVISEVLLKKDGVAYGGLLSDVVEIYNRTDKEVNTKGWFLSDKDDPYRYALPERTLGAGECIVIYCDNSSDEGHTGFALSSTDTLRLTGPNHKHGAVLTCIPAGDGMSWQWIGGTGDSESAYRASAISMGHPNTDAGVEAYGKACLPAGLRISEAMSSNSKYLRSSYGAACDWVELYNASDKAISLSGYYLSDDPELLRKGALPAVSVQPGEYFVVFLAKDPEGIKNGYPILPFGLSSAGDRLYLSNENRIVDQMILPAIEPNMSFGRANGESGFSLLAEPTPCEANTGKAKISEPPVTETAQGVYNGVSAVDVVLKGDGIVYYTTDCSVPTTASNEYKGPIRLTKTTVIRAICVKNGCTPSKVKDLSYIINENHTIAVASLVTTPENLWDYYTGIYADGPGYSRTEFPHEYANFWQQWEKEADVSLFEKDGGGFSEPCGIRIFGAYSRALDMKSFSCFFRGSYGTATLNYPLFGEAGLDSYEAFIFRNTGQDFTKARMRDPLLTEIAETYLNMPVQKNRPVALYLNGEFWGIYYIREKINENYVAGNYNVTKDEVTLTRANGTTSPEYQELIAYVRSHDLNVQENYDYVASQVDLQNYMDYLIAEIWICNTDNGNIKFFKTENGKWKWIMYDVDQSFRTAYFDTVAEHLNPAGTGSMDRFSTALINALLKRGEFKDAFLKRMAWQMNNVWTPEILNAAIDRYAAAIRPEMTRDCANWGLDYNNWEANVRALHEFANTRGDYMLQHIKKKFGLSDEQMRAYGFKV